MKMKDELISFSTAKLAKEKGFDIPTINCYNVDNRLLEFIPVIKGGIKDAVLHGGDILFDDWNNNGKESKSAPTQSLLQKWLREKHKINVESNYLPNIPGYRCLFVPMTDKISAKEKYKLFSKYYGTINYDTYEEALEAGLQEALKLI
jgi:hypothetical protein